MRTLMNLIVLAFLLALSATAIAQEGGYPEATSGGAQYYVYAGKDWELQISVYIWGHVLKPGMYSVPRSTDLIGVISLAGGPGQYANLKDVKVIRSNPGPEILKVDVLHYMQTANAAEVPVLHPGDTVVVPGSKTHALSRVVSFISQLAIVANVYYLFFIHGQ
jgi:hypothetical protein